MRRKLDPQQLISRKDVAYEFPGLTVRFLEECMSKTKFTGELVGPVYYQLENTIKYKVQHIQEYLKKNEVNTITAKDLEKKCQKNREICKRYNFVKKKQKELPHIPHKSQKSLQIIEKKNKRII